jgi:hypothetical protein
MTLTIDDRVPILTSFEIEAQALFREAKRRERRRRIVAALVGLVLVAGIVAGIVFWATRHPSLPPASPKASTLAASRILGTTETAHFSFVAKDSTNEGCGPITHGPIVKGAGTVNFSTDAVSYSWGMSGCRTDSAIHQFMQVGGDTYIAGPGAVGTSSTQPWFEIPKAKHGLYFGVDGAGLQSVLTSPKALAILHVPTSAWTLGSAKSATSDESTTYTNTITLAQLYLFASTQLGLGAPLYRDPVVPDANAISISLREVVGGHGEVRQLSASEPLYTAVYQDGSNERNADQADTLSTQGSGGGVQQSQVPIKQLIQNGFYTVTINYFDYGSRDAITAPAPTQVVVYHGA